MPPNPPRSSDPCPQYFLGPAYGPAPSSKEQGLQIVVEMLRRQMPLDLGWPMVRDRFAISTLNMFFRILVSHEPQNI